LPRTLVAALAWQLLDLRVPRYAGRSSPRSTRSTGCSPCYKSLEL